LEIQDVARWAKGKMLAEGPVLEEIQCREADTRMAAANSDSY
jgi:hypothetical protein